MSLRVTDMDALRAAIKTDKRAFVAATLPASVTSVGVFVRESMYGFSGLAGLHILGQPTQIKALFDLPIDVDLDPIGQH